MFTVTGGIVLAAILINAPLAFWGVLLAFTGILGGFGLMAIGFVLILNANPLGVPIGAAGIGAVKFGTWLMNKIY